MLNLLSRSRAVLFRCRPSTTRCHPNECHSCVMLQWSPQPNSRLWPRRGLGCCFRPWSRCQAGRTRSAPSTTGSRRCGPRRYERCRRERRPLTRRVWFPDTRQSCRHRPATLGCHHRRRSGRLSRDLSTDPLSDCTSRSYGTGRAPGRLSACQPCNVLARRRSRHHCRHCCLRSSCRRQPARECRLRPNRRQWYMGCRRRTNSGNPKAQIQIHHDRALPSLQGSVGNQHDRMYDRIVAERRRLG